MNTSRTLNYFIPITHLIFLATGICIATTIAFKYHQELLLIYTLCCMSTLAFYYKPQYLITYCTILFFAWHTSNNIQTRIQALNTDHEYLQTPVTIRGRIAQKNYNSAHKNQVIIILKNCQIQKSFFKKLTSTKTIMLLMSAKHAQNLESGKEILIKKVILQQPEPAADFYQYLLKENIWATAFIKQPNITVLRKESSIMYQCYTVFTALLNPESSQLFEPLFLGKRDKTISSIAMQHQSLYWGIAHHMARSGIHLVTLLSLVLAIFHLLRIRYIYRYIMCSVLALCYFQISVINISFMRALSMMLMQMFSKLHQFNYSSAHALSLTTLILVTYNPFIIFFLDFQLSFGITAAIIWLFNKKYAKTIVLPTNNSLPL
ncbi:ComEC/Rec2 family competence protein [Candidatus Babeliales bacterium]|nr:ComEC/Rec2 family competence protein [Candidatus Babeliales bacterium]